MIADPLHRLECPLDNDGGYAIVVASEAVARNCRKPPVWILGGDEATYTDGYMTITPDWFPDEGQAVRRAAEVAFGQSGVTREEIDVASLYDCFPVTVARDLEEMGFCERGEGAAYIHAGHLTLEGKMPTNTDGGLLSSSHPGNPGGLQVIEVARQLRGECDRRQVAGAKIGVVLSQGWAVHGLAGTAVLAAD
jgi:acetyl-CoA acetyltransferase